MHVVENKQIIQVAVPRPLHSVYDYMLNADMAIPEVGTRVEVPFGNTHAIGICINASVHQPHRHLKTVIRLLDQEPLIPENLMSLAHWMTDYYHHPIGEVLSTIIPTAARKGVNAVIDAPDYWRVAAAFDNPRAKAQTALHQALTVMPGKAGKALVDAGHSRATIRKLEALGAIERCQPEPVSTIKPGPEPNPEQTVAIDTVLASTAQYKAFLLEGITGSGKTEVYLRIIHEVLLKGHQALVLVPEIALTPQTVARFKERFERVGVLHSALTDHDRLQTWLKAMKGEVDVLVGTRSAVFTPFQSLGVIIVDEEHDSSYKQQDGLRYSARDIAIKRAHTLNIPIVLGSATPSLESLHNVDRNRYVRLRLTQRAGNATLPTYHIIDLRGQPHEDGLSVPLQHVIRRHIKQGGQTLVFLNRRGYAPTLLCAACGWQAQCRRCDARLTLHQTPPQLICHHCGIVLETPTTCDSCQQSSLIPVGLGTQRTEAGLHRLFSDIPIYRIDRDTTRSNRALETQFDRINSGGQCIMVGTQMLAKGHHFPDVTLVVILNADAGFLSPDFRAPERTAQLIVQVAGRAGRAHRPGEVWIQSYQPDNPTLRHLIETGYIGFAEHELSLRQRVGMPPYQAMAMLRADAHDPSAAKAFLDACKTQFHGVEVMGPVAAPLARIADRSRYQLMLLAPTRTKLHNALSKFSPPKAARNLRWSIDIDPYDSL